MLEQFKRVKNFEDRYLISNLGRVVTFYKNGKQKQLKWQENNFGYMKVNLWVNGIRKIALVHKLVAEHFIPNPDNKTDVNHKIRDKRNNAFWNLEWMTRKDNMDHYYDSIKCKEEAVCI